MKLLARLLVSASILALVFTSIDRTQLPTVAANASLPLLLGAVLMQLASSSLAAYRWQLLMRNLEFGQSAGFYWRSYFKAAFFNQGLPTSIGGDAVRVLDVARQGFRKRDALYGVILDRALGLASLLAVNLAAYAFAPERLPREIFYLALALAGAGLLGAAVAWWIADFKGLERHPRLLPIKRLSLRLRSALASRRLLLLVNSLLVHALAVLCVALIGRAFGLTYGLLTYLIIVPPAILLTVIPVSLAGWGVREGALVALFSLIGADATVVLTMSITYGLTLIITSMPGFVVYLRERQRVV